MNNSDRSASPNDSATAPSKPFSSSDTGMSLCSGKVNDSHRRRQAIVYVRQSTMQQVLEHRESADRQYGLVHRAVTLGWPGSQVEIIDEDDKNKGHLATQSIDSLAKRYVNQTPYPFRDPKGEVRVLYKVEPTRILTFGNP